MALRLPTRVEILGKKTVKNSESQTLAEGTQFGDLTVTKLSSVGQKGAHQWLCTCLCGTARVFSTAQLKSGLAKTCGSHKSRVQTECDEKKSRDLRQFPKGVGAGTRLYRIWGNMKSRCNNENFPKYKDYGARGIKVCPEWLRFGAFMEWSLQNGYAQDLTIDRIDNYKGYEPGNCRWATTEVQGKNRRVPRNSFTAFGETKTVGDWAKDPRCRIGYKSLAHRYLKGWSAERMLTEPVAVGRPPKSRVKGASRG